MMTNTIQINRPLVCISALDGKSSGIEPVYKEKYMRTVRKVHDIQDELYALIGLNSTPETKHAIHDRQWDKAIEGLTEDMDRAYDTLMRLKEARKVIKRIKR